MPHLTYSDNGLNLTKAFEGLRLQAYQDVAGIWTIGYGHTGPDVVPGLNITDAQATALLREDLADAVQCVNRAVTVDITQNQFDALVDFCFNAGRGHFLNSTLLRQVNVGDMQAAAAQFALWVYADGKVVPPLARRRAAEAQLFTTTS